VARKYWTLIRKVKNSGSTPVMRVFILLIESGLVYLVFWVSNLLAQGQQLRQWQFQIFTTWASYDTADAEDGSSLNYFVHAWSPISDQFAVSQLQSD
jgi:hypothetical protein